MSQNGILRRWKNLLDSKDMAMHQIALMEIAEMVGDEKSEKPLALINSDAFHFISRIMSYQQKSSLLLINKIVCHVSRVPQFYVHDFFRVLRGYASVINSFPITGSCGKDQEYQRIIFFSVNFIIKRAFEHNCNFSSRDMPLNCFISNVCSLHEARLCNHSALETVNLMIKLMIVAPCAEATKFREEKILQVAKKLNMERSLLESVAYATASIQVLQNLLNFIPESVKEQATVHEIIKHEMTDKFQSLMEFVSMCKIQIEHFELFVVLFFYLLVSEKLSEASKLRMVTRFFDLKGHWKLVSMISTESEETKPPLRSKVRLLLSHVLCVYLKFISETFGVTKVTINVCFRIVSNANLQNLCPIHGGHGIETTLLFIFMTFVDFLSEKPSRAPEEVLSSLALVLATASDQIAPPFQIMLAKLFTASYSKVQIDGNFLLPIASVELQKLPKNHKTIDLNFLKWWKEAGNPSSEVFNRAAMDFLKLCDASQLVDRRDHLAIFDRKAVLEAFLKKTPIEMHNKLSSVLCQLQLMDEMEFHRLLEELKKVSKSKSPQKICNVLAVVNSYNVEMSASMKKVAAKAILDFLKQSTELEIESKMLAIEIATKLMRIK